MSDREWYVAVENESRGPFSEADMQQAFRAGQIAGETHVWSPGMEDWAPASTISELTTPSASSSNGGALKSVLEGVGFVLAFVVGAAALAGLGTFILSISPDGGRTGIKLHLLGWLLVGLGGVTGAILILVLLMLVASLVIDAFRSMKKRLAP